MRKRGRQITVNKLSSLFRREKQTRTFYFVLNRLVIPLFFVSYTCSQVKSLA